ncbi:flagellar motor switch protein FliN [Oscillospiraceae bacterium 21-37]
MSNDVFRPIELDAIGEIMNISLGSSATAVSNLLDHRVDITTPTVEVVNVEDFSLGSIEPAVGVEIKYVEGLEGSNIMLLRLSDIKVIVDILMGTDTPLEDFVLDDLTLSAACEVMNQMMGAASTALSDFLGRVVNISTPQTFDVYDLDAFKKERMPIESGPIVAVRFALSIEGKLKSEFMNVISVELAKELIAGFGLDTEEETLPAPAPAPAPAAPAPAPAPSSGGVMSQEEIEKMLAGGAPAAAPAPAPAPSSGGVMSQEEIEKMLAGGAPAAAPAPAPAPSSGGVMSQEEIEKMLAGGVPAAAPAPAPAAPAPAAPAPVPPAAMPPEGMAPPPYYPPYPGQEGQQGGYPGYPGYYPPPYYGWPAPPAPQPADPKVIPTQQPKMPKLENGQELSQEQAENLDLIMNVPLEVTVEIGRTRRRVQEILAFAKGSLVVLDKLAGDQVDLFVNGKCIARGDVVVVDDNFGIRVTEILKKPDLEDVAQLK